MESQNQPDMRVERPGVQPESGSPIRRLTVQYVCALGLVAALILLGQCLIQTSLQRQQADAHVINLAGRQRMLSQKLVKTALAMQSLNDRLTPTKRRRQMEETLALWRRTHSGLQRGDAGVGLPDSSNSLLIRQMFGTLQPRFDTMYTAATVLLAHAANPHDPACSESLRILLQEEPIFLQNMDSIVFQYNLEAQTRVCSLRQTEQILTALTLAILVLEGLFVFRPSVRRIQKAVESLLAAQARIDTQNRELELANARLRELAETDGLTGLKNYLHLQQVLQTVFQRSRSTAEPFSVLMLDVDGFKQYNDRFGHLAGDEALQQIAALLQAHPAHCASRYGGEEFAVILQATGEEAALIFAETLRGAIAAYPWPLQSVTASFGVATWTPQTQNAWELVSQADRGLYASKQRGRNCVTHAREIQEADILYAKNAAELTQAYDATVEAWSYFLDLRDKETEGHTARVTQMSLQLAQAMNLNAEELVYVRWGALLHDIGKLGIPDSILLKPGPLTEEEWEVMRRHTDYAHEMLSPIGFLNPALAIPHYHHEKWDGSGYPCGLAGEDIPFPARIFAIVDVWDALRSDRPYRKGWSDTRIREHILSLSGSHFDPVVVEAFLKIMPCVEQEVQETLVLQQAA